VNLVEAEEGILITSFDSGFADAMVRRPRFLWRVDCGTERVQGRGKGLNPKRTEVQ